MVVGDSPLEPKSTPELEFTFSQKDANGVFPHEDDPMVINVHMLDWEITRVLVDLGSSATFYIEALFRGLSWIQTIFSSLEAH